MSVNEVEYFASSQTFTPFERRLEALPEPLQYRIQSFQRRNPGWLAQFGDIELAICEQAAAIAAAVGEPERFAWWWALSLEDKLFYTPGLDPQISEFAIQEAVNLAYALIVSPELVPQMHGVLCSLAGCAGYGCYAAPIDTEGEEIG